MFYILHPVLTYVLTLARRNTNPLSLLYCCCDDDNDDIIIITNQVCLGSKFFQSILETHRLKFMIVKLETFLCSVSALQVKVAVLLSTLELLVLFVWGLAYLEPQLFQLVLLYNSIFLIINV
jgi:hypothetical protein